MDSYCNRYDRYSPFFFLGIVFYLANGPVIYTSEKEGSDESGDGSAQKPFKSVMQVYFTQIFATIFTLIVLTQFSG